MKATDLKGFTMRVTEKKSLLSLLNLIKKYHQKSSGLSEDILIEGLTECQQAAIVAGNFIEEKLEGESCKEIIKLLEEYCEEAYKRSQKETFDDKFLIDLIEKAIYIVNDISVEFVSVFCPYKASMWDSLESIYLVAEKDENCKAFVMPIPYYELNSSGEVEKRCYEGNKFPRDIPITDYQELNLEELHPDAIYIHNPYDNYNYVTSVEPAYYSVELKKHTDCLVYVPYFVSPNGVFSDVQQSNRSYDNIDRIIAQSQKFKDCALGQPYYDKIIPLGSPKIDKVIRLSKEHSTIPSDWKKRMKGRKVVMLNTSINNFLSNSEVAFKNLKRVFETVKKIDGITLIWRPHPLLEATIVSMRPQFQKEYRQLKEYFYDNKIGIFDDTEDIDNIVAISDAYIGELASSVVSLFEATGKPIFILNENIHASDDNKSQRLDIADIIKNEKDDSYWIFSNGGLFKKTNSWESIEWVGRDQSNSNWNEFAYSFSGLKDGKLYLSPNTSKNFASYHVETKQIEYLSGMHADRGIGKSFIYKDKIFYLSKYSKYILIYDTRLKKWKKIVKPIENWLKDVEAIPYFGYISDFSTNNDMIILTCSNTNVICIMNLENLTSKLLSVDGVDCGFSSVIFAKENTWYLTTVETGTLLKLNLKTGVVQFIEMPKSYEYTIHPGMRKPYVFKKMYKWDRYIFLIPYSSNNIIRLDTQTDRTDLFHPELSKDLFENNIYGVGMVWIEDNKLMMQRLDSGNLIEINLSCDRVKVEKVRIAEKSANDMLMGESGFSQNDNNSAFYCNENYYFTLENFLLNLRDDKLSDVKSQQLNAVKDFFANNDGTSGEKIHGYIRSLMNV